MWFQFAVRQHAVLPLRPLAGKLHVDLANLHAAADRSTQVHTYWDRHVARASSTPLTA